MPELRPIPGYDGYFAGDDGEIYSMRPKNGHPVPEQPLRLKGKITWAGYREYGPRDGNDQFTEHGHQLVAAAFHGPCPDGMQCDHKNRDRADNRPDNLRYVTPEENQQNRTPKQGKPNIRPRLVAEIWFALKAGMSQLEIARTLGVSRGTVNSIARGTSWRWLTGHSVEKRGPMWARVLANRERAMRTNTSRSTRCRRIFALGQGKA